ncbi:hypothetical protein NP493_8560g00002, partial [Ridgeia piscesae]
MANNPGMNTPNLAALQQFASATSQSGNLGLSGMNNSGTSIHHQVPLLPCHGL